MKFPSDLPPLSGDIWNYLRHMPYMPPRTERDALLHDAEINAANEKRLSLWDYFFRIDPELLVKDQKDLITHCEKQIGNYASEYVGDVQKIEKEFDNSDKLARQKWRKRIKTSLVSFCVSSGIAILFCSIYLDLTPISLPRGVIRLPLQFSIFSVAIVFLVFTIIIQLRSRNLEKLKVARSLSLSEKKIEYEQYDSILQHQIWTLQRQMTWLKRQIPKPPTDGQVNEWLSDDMERLRIEALQRAGANQLLDQPDETENSGQEAELEIFYAPAELQNDVPRILRKDKTYHLTARRYAELPNEVTQIFYGAYCFEFIVVMSDQLAAYRCYWDFVTGQLLGEMTSEQYYSNVEALNYSRETRYFNLLRSGQLEQTNVPDAPTFVLVLGSGKERRISFPSMLYLQSVQKHLGSKRVDGEDLKTVFETFNNHVNDVYKRLRWRLREHKAKVLPDDI